jgi:GNAT superfamily N-acetyltransferase
MIHDIDLARRIEAAYARDGEAMADADRRIHPDGGATYERLAGGSMIFCGVASFMTHALGIGVNGPVSDEDLDRLEAFYFGRGAGVEIDLCPFADPTLPGRLFDRGYRPDHFEQVLVRELFIEEASSRIARVEGVRIVPATPELEGPYCELLARAFDLPDEFRKALEDAGHIAFASEDVSIYAGLAGDRLVAAGAMRMAGGVAGLFGAATLPEYRGRGLQSALLTIRLRDAAQQACDLASVKSLVGSTSERNIERAGFHPAYTRTVLKKARPDSSR